MTQTLERTSSHSPVENDAHQLTVYEIIDMSLSKVEEMDEKENARQLASLIICTQRIGLLQYMKEERLDEFVEVIPNAADLVQKIHDTADMVLETEKLDGESLMIISNLGAAADITRDASLLDKTLDAIEDTNDIQVAPLVKALTIARTEDRTFTEVYKIIKTGGKALAGSDKPFIPMSQRPDFHEDHEYAYLSTPIAREEAYKPKHRAVAMLTDDEGNPVTAEESVFGIEKDPATGLFADQSLD